MQSVVGSVVAPTEQAENEGEAFEKAMTELRAGSNKELIDGDQPNVDQFTNYKKEDNEMEIDKEEEQLSEGQEAINVAPGLDEEADIEKEIEMVGFEDFQDDFKPGAENNDFNDFNEEQNDIFQDHLSNHLEVDDNAESVRALTLKDGVNYEDDKFDE